MAQRAQPHAPAWAQGVGTGYDMVRAGAGHAPLSDARLQDTTQDTLGRDCGTPEWKAVLWEQKNEVYQRDRKNLDFRGKGRCPPASSMSP